MSTVTGTSVLVLGGPSVGKTTFLMQLYGRVATEECMFKLRQAPESLTAIKDGWNRLQQGFPPGHTPHGTDASLTLPVVDAVGRYIDITVPDYAGEDLRRIGEQRRFSDRWRHLAAGSDHWLLVMRLAQHPDIPDLITRPIGELASTGPLVASEHNPSLPADMLAVELLQVLLHTRMREHLPADRELHLTLVLSCWDELETPAGTKPGEVASKRLALLDSFCRSHWGARYRVFGLSSQGQELDEGTPAQEYLELGPQKMGWLVDPAGSNDPDLTKLIALSE
jgi:hypothetical protein